MVNSSSTNSTLAIPVRLEQPCSVSQAQVQAPARKIGAEGSMRWQSLAQICPVAAKAVEYAAVQALCEVQCASESREAPGVRRLPPLFTPSVRSLARPLFDAQSAFDFQ